MSKTVDKQYTVSGPKPKQAADLIIVAALLPVVSYYGVFPYFQQSVDAPIFFIITGIINAGGYGGLSALAARRNRPGWKIAYQILGLVLLLAGLGLAAFAQAWIDAGPIPLVW